VVFSNYHATIQIDTSATYSICNDWVEERLEFGGAVKCLLLIFDSFYEVNVLGLAELASLRTSLLNLL
jgi:hypothetical protein